jgi:two-component sensor histidine kinase
MTIEHQQSQQKLKAALDRHQVLLKEVNHRVKNSLQVVINMLQLQANTVGDPILSERLHEASTRISAIGRAYDRLAYNPDHENIDLIAYLREVMDDLQSAVAPCTIHLEASEQVQFAADRAILVALVINELVLNAAKHAYPDSHGGVVWIQFAQRDSKTVTISVRDEGVGMPHDFDLDKSRRLGTRLIKALATQLGAELTRPTSTEGSIFTLIVPLQPASAN